MRVAKGVDGDVDGEEIADVILLSPVASIDCEADGTRRRPETDCDDVELALLLRPPSLRREPVLVLLVRESLLISSIGSFLSARSLDVVQFRARLL